MKQLPCEERTNKLGLLDLQVLGSGGTQPQLANSWIQCVSWTHNCYLSHPYKPKVGGAWQTGQANMYWCKCGGDQPTEVARFTYLLLLPPKFLLLSLGKRWYRTLAPVMSPSSGGKTLGTREHWSDAAQHILLSHLVLQCLPNHWITL